MSRASNQLYGITIGIVDKALEGMCDLNDMLLQFKIKHIRDLKVPDDCQRPADWMRDKIISILEGNDTDD